MSLTNFRQIFLPYCIKKNKKGEFIVLNREYKPLGFATYQHIIYEDYPIGVQFLGLTEDLMKRLSINGSIEEDTIFLYNDATIPTKSKKNMEAYLYRLELLSRLKVRN